MAVVLNGTVYVCVPDLKGCMTTGRDLQDAIEQIENAIATWITPFTIPQVVAEILKLLMKKNVALPYPFRQFRHCTFIINLGLSKN